MYMYVRILVGICAPHCSPVLGEALSLLTSHFINIDMVTALHCDIRPPPK